MRTVLTPLVAAVAVFRALAANLAYVPQSGDGPWEWNEVGNWFNNVQATASQTAVGRLPGSSDHVYLYSGSLAGRVYEFPQEDQVVHSRGIVYANVPVYDSPFVLTDLAALDGIFAAYP